MDFIHGMMWLGGLTIAAPIIIHLLNRQRYKKVEWAAMRFIVEAIKRTHRRLRLEELLLLLMRCAILLLLVSVLARPIITGSILGMRMEGNYHAIVAIDTTYSMESKVGHQKMFDRAREVAAQIIGTLKRGDRLSIVLMSQHPTTLHSDPTIKFEEASNELADLKSSHFGGTLDDSLELIRSLANKAKPTPSHLYLITDNQAKFWNALQTAEAKKTFHDITSAVRTVVIDVGAPTPGNLSVTNFKTDAPLLTPTAPFHFVADIANYSPAPVSNAEVSLLVDGERVHTQAVSVEAGKSSTVTFSYSFTSAGPHSASVQLEPDTLATDNSRHLALQVEDTVKVLVVDPRPAVRDVESETFFLRLALNPQFSENRQEIAPFRPTLVSPSDLPSIDLKEYPVIVLANIDQLPVATVGALTEFVKSGGGLLIFLGSRVDPRTYNAAFFRNGEGFLPAPLLAKAGDPSHEKYVRLDLEAIDHPIARKLKQESWPMYAYQYISTAAPLPPDAQVVARYAMDGQTPAIVERSIGKGRSVMVTTSCGDPNWSELFVSPTMIMLVQEYGLFLCSGSAALSTFQVGDSLTHTLPQGLIRRDFLLQPPTGDPIPQTASPDASGRMKLTFNDLDHAGIYRLLERETVVAYFAANVDPTEGDLTRISAAELDTLRTAYNFTVTSYDHGIESFGKEGAGKELWSYLLIALALMMFTEMFFAWKFGSRKK